jgi:phosphohistidine phosphatase SixA
MTFQSTRRRLIARPARAALVLSAALLAAHATRAEAQYAIATKPAASTKATTTTLDQLVADLRNGGYVIVLRHGATNANQADTDPFHLDNISAQRLLSDDGRAVAANVGEAFRKLGIPFGEVYSSQFNRASETARLVSGKAATTTPDLTEGGLVVSPSENARRATALKTMATAVPTAGANTLIVTHKPNILDAFGKDWFDSKEGEASVFKPNGSKDLVLVARVQAADWIKSAGGY